MLVADVVISVCQHLEVMTICLGTSAVVISRTYCTAAIKTLLTHLCISVALNIIVHPQLTCEHRHHTIRDCTPNFATPAGQIPADPSQIQIFSQARYKLLTKVIRNLGLNSRIFSVQAVQCAR